METATVTATKAPATPSPQASVPKKKSKTAYLIGAIVLLLLVIGAIVAMYLASKSQETRQQAFEAPTTPPDLARFVPQTPVPISVPALPAATLAPTPTPVPQPGVQAPRTNTYRTLPSLKVDATAGQVAGQVCPYGNNSPAGTVLFFNVDTQSAVQTRVAAGQKTYTTKVPAGDFLAFFYPDDLTLPPANYSQYTKCGANPATCTVHAPALVSVAAKQTVNNVDLCDQQTSYLGLPNVLYQ